MTNSVLIVIIISMAAALGLHIGAVFAMHDSTLDVNTWIASDNSTQLHTIDLNKGVQSPSAAAGASTTPGETADESTEDTSAAADENGDETIGSDGDESDNESSIEDENGGDEE
ncbi:MAG: hypothetical protein ACR2IS_00350 [Nitrososphaeraceae archaeon]